MRVASDLGLRFAEVRSAWGTNILDLADSQCKELARLLEGAGLAVSCIASPIGKSPVTEDFNAQLLKIRRALEVAEMFESKFIRVFSFWLPKGADPAEHRHEVLLRMKTLTDLAEAADVTLLHENEKGIYGDVPERCLDIVEHVDSKNLLLTWDAANFVQVGVRPYTDGYTLLRPYLAYVQVKDARCCDGAVVPPGQGDGELDRTVRALHEDGFEGFFSLEPHLANFGPFGGYSGGRLFTHAYNTWKSMLEREGIPVR